MSLWTIITQLANGFLQTLSIFLLTLVFSLPFGWLVYFGRKSKIVPVKWLVTGFISVMRGTPLMLQLLVWYFGPYYLFGISIGGYKFTAIILGFSFNYAAYFAEIYRSGVEAIDIGQYEACQILGYSRTQTYLRIIFPQVFKIILPSVGNEIITLVKDTSLVYSLSYIEMFALAKQIAAAQTTMTPFVVAGVFYYVFNALVAAGLSGLEKKFGYYK